MTYFDTFCQAARDYNEALAAYYSEAKSPEDTRAVDYYNAKISGMFQLAASEGVELITTTNDAGFIIECKSIRRETKCKTRITNAKSLERLFKEETNGNKQYLTAILR